MTKGAQPTEVKKKGENDQNMVEETRGELHMKESGPKVEEDQVMVETEAEANRIGKETECTAEGRQEDEYTVEGEDKEMLENHQPNFASAEGLIAEDEEYGDEGCEAS